MAPKKKEQQKMSLGDFLGDSGFGGGSWADEVEETYTGTQPLPPSDRSRYGGGGATSSWQDRGYSVREEVPMPDRPPFTAHLGNLSYDATNETVGELFEGCDVASIRIIEDREMQRPKGFGYVEFNSVEGLKKALTLDSTSFQGRMIKIKVADPPRGGLERDPSRGDAIREMGDWSRKGPLSDPPARAGRQPSDFGERRAPRDPAGEPKPNRDFNWERRGPLAPLPQSESPRGPPEGLGERSESSRGNRRQSPATWGEGRPEGRPGPPTGPPEGQAEGSRPPRREVAPSAADKDMQWRDRMRAPAPPAAPAVQSPPSVHDASTPASPVPQAAVPASTQRPKLNLAKRTVSEATDAATPSAASDAKASPFGAARPINTAAREQEIEDKRQQAIREKKEADEKAKEDRRLAKEAAAAEAAAEAVAPKEEAPVEEATKESETAKPEDSAAETPTDNTEEQNGATEAKLPVRSREPKENPKQARSFDAGNWRSASSNDTRGSRGPRGDRGGRGGGRGDRSERGDGPPRGPRGEGRGTRSNGPPREQQPASGGENEAPSRDEDGWTTVPAQKKGRQGKPLVS